jgi:hypothetical protein
VRLRAPSSDALSGKKISHERTPGAFAYGKEELPAIVLFYFAVEVEEFFRGGGDAGVV